MKEKCKYCMIDATFDCISEKDRFDIINGKAHSLRGIWKEDSKGICIKFQDVETQFKKNKGFYYCNEERLKECSYYIPKVN